MPSRERGRCPPVKPVRVGAIWTSCDFGSVGPEPCSRHCGGLVTRLLAITASLLTPVVILLGGCTSSGGTDSSSTPASSPGSSTISTPSTPPTSSSPSSPAPSNSPESTAAVTVYRRWAAATYAAERSPAKNHTTDLRALAVDPALGTFQGLLTQLQVAGIANRGTPPTSRTRVLRTELAAKPYPKVTVVDCPTVSPTWVAYDVKTGKPVKVTPNPVKPPYAITAEVIKLKGNWVVYRTTADRKHTCSP